LSIVVLTLFQVGFLFTYVAPLIFVLTITVVKEGYDDFQRYKRDATANSQIYRVLSPDGEIVHLPSGRLQVFSLSLTIDLYKKHAVLIFITHVQCGHVVLLSANDRVPAGPEFKSRI
jgi:magnesium-transporting ATPase (P-type)